MVETNRQSNPSTQRQWDVQSLTQKLLEMQDALLQAQERNISLTAQTRELERISRDHEDMKIDMENQAVLLADKARENKYLHQELSRMSGVLSGKLAETEDLRNQINEVLHQLKTCQSERDLLSLMLTEAEAAARKETTSTAASRPDQSQTTSWINRLKNR